MKAPRLENIRTSVLVCARTECFAYQAEVYSTLQAVTTSVVIGILFPNMYRAHFFNITLPFLNPCFFSSIIFRILLNLRRVFILERFGFMKRGILHVGGV